MPFEEALDASDDDLLIVGDGGSGKTAAAVKALVHFTTSDRHQSALPVFVPLPRLKASDVAAEGGLDRAIAGALGCDEATLRDAAAKYRVVAILDSLDETAVPDAQWHGLLKRNPIASKCRIIMTSRPTPLATTTEGARAMFGADRKLRVLQLQPLPATRVDALFQKLL